jgi:hypothetical protein
MMTLSSFRRTAAAAVLASFATLAAANEAAVEGQGELGGPKALIYLVAGVAAMGVVIWLVMKIINKTGK